MRRYLFITGLILMLATGLHAADVKFPDYVTAASSGNAGKAAGDLVPVIQGGATVKLTLGQFLNLLNGDCTVNVSTAEITCTKINGGTVADWSDAGSYPAGQCNTALNTVGPCPAQAIIDGSTGTGPTAAQMADPRCHVSNYGQAASDQYSQLPTAAANLSCLFSVDAARANKWGVKAGSNTITPLNQDGTIGTTGSSGGYLRFDNAVIGQELACWSYQSGASSYDWRCKAISVGTGRTLAAN